MENIKNTNDISRDQNKIENKLKLDPELVEISEKIDDIKNISFDLYDKIEEKLKKYGRKSVA